MIDANAFNFDAMKEAVGADPFADTNNNKYAKDERFYTLSKDKEGNGAALIRFLPDSEKGMIQKMFKVNTTIVKNGKKRFVSEFSPSTIGQPCPFQERWQEQWNKGVKDDIKDVNGVVTEYGAKTFSRGVRYVVNIKVLKDPANPENEGKIFLYEMSGAMKDKIQNAVNPSEQDRSLGAQPKELFNPVRGNSFRLVAKKGANGQINYDSSEVINEVTSIYDSVEQAVEDINNNTHKLSGLLEADSFMSYEELQNKLNWVTFSEQAQTNQLQAQVAEVTPAQPEVNEAAVASVAQVQETEKVAETVAQPAQTAPQGGSLDDLLNDLV